MVMPTVAQNDERGNKRHLNQFLLPRQPGQWTVAMYRPPYGFDMQDGQPNAQMIKILFSSSYSCLPAKLSILCAATRLPVGNNALYPFEASRPISVMAVFSACIFYARYLVK